MLVFAGWEGRNAGAVVSIFYFSELLENAATGFWRLHTVLFKNLLTEIMLLLLCLSGPKSRDVAILSLRYPLSRDTFCRQASTRPEFCDTLLGTYFTQARLRDPHPHFATYCAISVRYTIKTSTKQFCDTIATSTVVSNWLQTDILSGRNLFPITDTESRYQKN